MRDAIYVTPATTLKPTKGKVLLEPIWPTPQVRGLYIPKSAEEDRPEEATVLALGEGAKTEARIGDRVVTDRFNGKWVIVGDRKYRLVDAEAVLAVVEEEVEA